ncbi:MAG: hypothetical protein EA425_05020 [Puniceicoccaceae bacterium]|nr:MAG: hypothetical protein EA425_05020 [Puniceicoccaceae bacterium]
MTPLSESTFLLFGTGRRRSWIYRAGALWPLADQGHGFQWETVRESIDGGAARVELETRAGAQVVIHEDENGLWLDEGGAVRCLDDRPGGRWPGFEGHPHAGRLRQLHHEILVNLPCGAPLPNRLVYSKPWYRDSAMVAMVLEKTGNLGLIEDWVAGLREPFDRNNRGHRESDNLGQALYLISLVSDRGHPLVETILRTLPEHATDGHLTGLSDYAPHPVYQTKWLLFGLRALGLDDGDWRIPSQPDNYSALFWWDFRQQHVPGAGFDAASRVRYPYLGWAEDHFHGRPPPLDLLRMNAPLTWEAEASEADYSALAALDPGLEARRIALPHTWHAAEAFLYLHELESTFP